MTPRQLSLWGLDTLKAASVPDAQKDVRKLLQASLNVQHLHDIDWDQDVSPELEFTFKEHVSRRANRIPMSHILGEREFFGRKFKVSSDVLDPRPETETLIEVALMEPFGRVLDLGTGSGCILATLLSERKEVTGIGADISLAALAVADQNIGRLGLKKRAELRRSNWFEHIDGRFDLIVSNPPYITADEMHNLQPEVRRHEPRAALTDEGDGLSCYQAILEGLKDRLSDRGRLIVEIGWSQGQAVQGLMSEFGLADVTIVKDLDGRDRVVVGRKSHE